MIDIKIDHHQLAHALQASDLDRLLISLIVHLIKDLGHRYGNVIDSVSVAAKLAVYLTYLETGRNLRRSGFLHHVEPRRVKEIAREFESLLENGDPLPMLGCTEPTYLIGLPHLWMIKYPMKTGESKLKLFNLLDSERFIIESTLVSNTPQCLAVRETHLYDMIQEMHEKAQATKPDFKKVCLSDALVEHARFRLLESGTVKEIKLHKDSSAYILTKIDYSPRDKQARIQTMVQDLLHALEWLRAWVNEDPEVMRGIETLTIHPEQKDEAFQELDQLMCNWADKYHSEDAASSIAIQFLIGPYQD